MKKLIKKILKEEFDWADEIQTNPAEEFLYNKFMECKLEPIENKEWLGWTKYIDKKGEILFLDNIDTGEETTILYFDYDKIYKKLEEMGLNQEEISVLVEDMLYDTHKRKVLTTSMCNSYQLNWVV